MDLVNGSGHPEWEVGKVEQILNINRSEFTYIIFTGIRQKSSLKIFHTVLRLCSHSKRLMGQMFASGGCTCKSSVQNVHNQTPTEFIYRIWTVLNFSNQLIFVRQCIMKSSLATLSIAKVEGKWLYNRMKISGVINSPSKVSLHLIEVSFGSWKDKQQSSPSLLYRVVTLSRNQCNFNGFRWFDWILIHFLPESPQETIYKRFMWEGV